MKKLLLCAMALAVLMALAACGEAAAPTKDTPSPALTPTPAQTSPAVQTQTPAAQETQTVPAKVQIEFATQEAVDGIDEQYQYVVDEEGAWVVISAEEPLSAFEFLQMGNRLEQENFVIFADQVLFSLEKLPQGQPFAIKMYAAEILPTHGIAYLGEDGEKVYLYIFESAEDGSVSLVEFENPASNEIR